jgi:PAS domain S-box-containing protein
MSKNTSRNPGALASLLTQAAKGAPWGLAITDHQRKNNPVVFVNRAFGLVIGHKADDVLGKSWRALLGKNPERNVLAQVQKAVTQGGHCSVVLQGAGKDGSRSHWELTVTPLHDGSRNVTHLTWLCRDITSQIEREERLASTITEKEERLAFYAEFANEAIWRLDFKPPIRLDIPESQQVRKIFENGVYGEANDAAARIYGLEKAADLIGKPLRAFMEPSNPENVQRALDSVRKRFRMRNLITYENDVHGKTHTCVNNITPGIENNQVQYMWGASLDVSERFKTLRALEQSQKELAEKAEALEEKNVALKELIAHIELDKKDYQDRITANIEQVLLPSLNRIQLHTSGNALIEQHRRSIEDLASSFGRRIADVRHKLTPREIEVCNSVKNGMTSKEIANLLNIAVHTVEKHRRTARSKLNLANKGINLRTYLESL